MCQTSINVRSTLPTKFVTKGAYHLTEKSGWGVENIMVSDLPVCRRNATSVTVWIQKKGEFVSRESGTEKELRNWLMVSNIPFGSYQPEWKDYLKTYSSIFGWKFRKVNLPFTVPSGISEIFCQMVSTPGCHCPQVVRFYSLLRKRSQ